MSFRIRLVGKWTPVQLMLPREPCFRYKLEEFLCSEKFTESWLAADIYMCIRHLLGLWNPRKLWRLTETEVRLFSLQRAPGTRRRLPQTCQTVSEITQVPPSRKPLSWGREKKARHKIHWFYSLLICIIKKNCKHFHTYIKMYFMEKVQICYVYITSSSCVSLTKKHWALLDTNVNKW